MLTRLALNAEADDSIISWFLANGANPDATCQMDMTPLSTAVQYAPFPVIERLFAYSQAPYHGQLLHYAALRTSNDCEKVIKLVLQQGHISQVNDTMYQNHAFSFEIRKCVGLGTPLHEAARTGNPGAIRVLLDNGADAAALNTCGQTALEVAEISDNRTVSDLIR